jgi:hypothetical protein
MAAPSAPPYRASTTLADRAVRTVMETIDALPLGDRLLALRSISGLVGSRRAGAVLAARAGGMSWGEIADRLGMSRQAVWYRYVPEEEGGPTARRRTRPASLRMYSSCASYKAVTTRPPTELSP